jgi:hypothetical protein
MYEEGSVWYKRFKKECERISPHIKFRAVKMGFVRIYWQNGGQPAYLHEVYRWMPAKGYNIEDEDPRFEDKRYFEEYEDSAELTMKIKNFVEGYWDSVATIRKRIYLMKNNKEANKTFTDAYRNVRVR